MLALEEGSRDTRGTISDRGFRVCEKLRTPLASLAGKTGYEALLSRALSLAKVDLPRLRTVSVKHGDCLQGFAEIEPRLNEQEFIEGETLVVGYIIELLRTFLGETLMLRLVRDVWPEAPLTDMNSGEGSNA